MQNNNLAKLATIILLMVMTSLLVYFYISLSRVDKKLVEIQDSIIQDSAKTQSIVNFFNANVNAQTNN